MVGVEEIEMEGSNLTTEDQTANLEIRSCSIQTTRQNQEETCRNALEKPHIPGDPHHEKRIR